MLLDGMSVRDQPQIGARSFTGIFRPGRRLFGTGGCLE